MEYLIVICGSLGAWLLVAGPVYQAALELSDQDMDHERIDQTVSSIPKPKPLSSWWWLLPPVAYVKQRKRSGDHRRAIMDALEPEQLEQTVSFLNKARGWLIVAFGAFLIAVKETWELTVLLHWPAWSFWLLVILALVICLGNTVLTMAQTGRMLAKDEAEAQSRRRPSRRRIAD
jgi:hypothetical protein